MGCRVPNLSFPITGVVPTPDAADILDSASPGSVVAFDEAQYFQASLAGHWLDAARRGVYVLVAVPSPRQLAVLAKQGIVPVSLNAPCAACGRAQSVTVVYGTSLKAPTHVCRACACRHEAQTLAQLLDDVKAGPPCSGEKVTDQPFHDVAMRGWRFVRTDTHARFAVLRNALERCPELAADRTNSAVERTFACIGCGSGYFCDAMTGLGFTATGVDDRADVIEWASRMALLKRQSIDYVHEDADAFVTGSGVQFDVVSWFADGSRLATPKDNAASLPGLDALFARTRHVCVLEVSGAGTPGMLEGHNIADLMRAHGGFAHVEVIPAGTRGLARDLVIGFKTTPRSVSELMLVQRFADRLRSSLWLGRIRRRVIAALRRP
jgi:hypothetical protein